MTYMKGYNEVDSRLDAKCGKGWEGVKGGCKRSKKADELTQGVKKLVQKMGDRKTKKGLSKRGMAAYIVALAAMKIGTDYMVMRAIEKAGRSAVESAKSRAKLQGDQMRGHLRSQLEQLEGSKERRSSIKHEQKLKNFFVDISDLAGGEEAILQANREIVDKVSRMSPIEVDKFFEQKRKDYEKLMDEGG